MSSSLVDPRASEALRTAISGGDEGMKRWRKTASDAELKEAMEFIYRHTGFLVYVEEELADRRERKEAHRHGEALRMASGANHIAKWAIVVAVLALIVAIVQTFWR